MKKAVIDRIVDQKHVVLLLGDEEKKVIVSIGMLPEGAIEGNIVQVDLDNRDQVTKLILDKEETKEAKDRVASMMDQLRSNKRS